VTRLFGHLTCAVFPICVAQATIAVSFIPAARNPAQLNFMSLLALSLVLASALGHATWNYWLKTSGGGLVFVWLFATAGCVLYLPLVAAFAWHAGFVPSAPQIALILISGLLHTAYYLLLDRGYRSGDFSLVYPLARATGPLLTLCVAVLFIGERPTPLGLAGVLTIVAGAFLLAGGTRMRLPAGSGRALCYALATGVMIAAYTLNDRQAVAVLLVPPLIFDWSQNLVRVLLLAPRVMKDRAALRANWRERRKAILIIALLCPLTYILVLAAMQLAPVSYVAAARELSILFGTLMGAHLLREADSHRRVTGAIVMVAGFVALARA